MTWTIVFGPPGTGKTTTGMRFIEERLERGIPPNRIGYIAFTRKAANEARARAAEKFGFTADDMPYFRTIHSLAFMQLGIKPSGMLQRTNYTELGEKLGIEVSGSFNNEDGLLQGMPLGDRYFFLDNLARITRKPLKKIYEESGDDEIDWHELDRVSRTLQQYKKIHKLYDFTDLLEQWLEHGHTPKLDSIFVDEAQDLSALQWDFVEKLTVNMEDKYVAGDDDQAIYRWAGADVERLIHLPGRRIILDQSYRVPRTVHAVATNLLTRIQSRVPKRFKPSDISGSVNWHFTHDAVDLSKGQWLLLARNSYLTRELEETCLRAGYPFESLKKSPLQNDSLKAIIAWTNLCKGQRVNGDALKLIYRFMGLRKRTDKERTYSLADVKLEPGIWHQRLTHISAAEREYYIAARRQGESLTADPRIKINTIHAVKGGEADNVLILTDMAARSYKYMQQYPDDEARVFYVGMTRAKHNLHLIQPQTNLFYEIG